MSSNSQLTGPLPDGITRLTRLRILEIRTAGLNGTLPQGVSVLSRLEQLVLDFNDLSGPLPELSAFKEMR